MKVSIMADYATAPYLPWTKALGIDLEEDRLSLFDTYLDELCRWNVRMNLVGPASRDRIVRELLLDSLVSFPLLPEQGTLLDVGSGAGFPAIALKICGSNLEFFLIESIRKRVNFLKQVIRITGLAGISVIRARVEESGAMLNPAGYDVVTARAVAPLPRTVRLCSGHVAPGGALFTFHGGSPRKALEQSTEEMKKGGLTLESLLPYRLPGLESQRHLAVLRKNGAKSPSRI
jgi:16S rRNA (guanine527-N7)-methyltransferase